MKTKSSWDGLSVKDEVALGWKPWLEKQFNKRMYVRIKVGELSALYDTQKIDVKISSASATFTDHLLDISEGGMALSLPKLLAKCLPVKVEFSLGKKKIISSAIVMQTRITGRSYRTGLKFVNLPKETAEYIGGSISIHALLNGLKIAGLPELLLSGKGSNVGFSQQS